VGTAWHLHCVDCQELHKFDDDANHREHTMWLLCKHAASIAALAPLVAEAEGEIEIKLPYRCESRVDPAWFVRHAAHRLSPIDEYGRLPGQCYHTATCASCKSTHRCSLAMDHEGECR
jgi:hypothetical protein